MKLKTRDSNIELLRSVLMLMIIIHHIIVHGLGLSLLSQDKLPQTPNIPVLILVNSFLIVAVNTYIFISAYYGLKFSIRNLLSFILQATFYSAAIYIIACYTGWDSWSAPNFYRSLIPILSGKWWFLSGYVLLFILSPILNAGLDAITKRQHLFILIAIILISASYYITNFNPDSLRINISTIGLFLTIYVCGRFIKKYPITIKKPLLWYLLFSLTTFLVVLFYYNFISYQLAWNIFGYTNPIIIAGSVCLFFTFKKLKIQNSLINKVSTTTLGIYLIHDADPVRRFLIYLTQQALVQNIGLQLLIVVGISITVFLACACIEKVRQIIFIPVLNRIMDSRFLKNTNI